MVIGLLTLELYLSASTSLKDKRQVLRRLESRLRNHFNLAIAEVDHQDLWQRSTLAIVSVSGSRPLIEKLFDSVIRESERLVPGELLRTEREFLG